VPFLAYLLPQLEQDNLSRGLNFNDAGLMFNDGALAAALKVPVPTFYCPSDGYGGITKLVVSQINSLTNYGGCFGITQNDSLNTRNAIFGVNRGAAIRDIYDGLSNTAIMSEILTGTPQDYRASAWVGNAGHGQFYTAITPNSSSPDITYPDPGQCPGGSVTDTSKGLQCVYGNISGLDNMEASRSRHPGGVNTLLADGSVRFISNNIALATWQNLGYMADGNVLGDF
jgi:prepilin-type processing-associated H-X9-DG protein